MQLTGTKIIVVGASGVLGGLLAANLQRLGADLMLTTSDASKLGALSRSGIALVLDLESSASIEAFCDSLAGQKIDGLVIAAGAVAFGPSASVPSSVLARLMRINSTGPIDLVTGLASNFSENSFVLSLSGKIAEIPTAGLAAYSASKAAIFAYSQAAGREMRKLGVRWLDARPGHTETGFANRALFGTPPQFGAGLTPESVAERLLAAIVNDERDLPSAAFD